MLGLPALEQTLNQTFDSLERRCPLVVQALLADLQGRIKQILVDKGLEQHDVGLKVGGDPFAFLPGHLGHPLEESHGSTHLPLVAEPLDDRVEACTVGRDAICPHGIQQLFSFKAPLFGAQHGHPEIVCPDIGLEPPIGSSDLLN